MADDNAPAAAPVTHPAHTYLRDRWRATRPLTRFGRGMIYRYSATTGLWTQAYEHIIRREIQRLIEKDGHALTARLITNVYQLARDSLGIHDWQFDARPDLLACRNGTLDLSTGELGEHKPEYYLTTGVEFDYEPEAAAPAWSSYLERLSATMSREVLDFLQEFAGLAATTDMHFETALWLHGPPGCGKSTFIAGLLAVLKSRSCTLSLADLTRSRFSLTNLPGKTLVTASEQPAKAVAAIDIINRLISGESILVDRKNLPPMDMVPVCKLVWAMNTLPRVVEAGSGVFRRIALVRFPALPETQRDPLLRQRIMQEGPGILNWMLEGLRRLRNKGRLEIPKEIQDARDEYQRANDIERQWVEAQCQVDNRLDQFGGELYADYREWCEQNGHRPLASNQFADRLRDLGYTKKRIARGIRWLGLALK